MDNKRWRIPRNAIAKRFANMRKVRFHLRTRAEGLLPGLTKPNANKNRKNPGASVNVSAGINKGSYPNLALFAWSQEWPDGG